MSTWIRENKKKSWIQSFCENVIKSGVIPRHVAVIMDGNRRYADRNNFKRSVGHLLGFNKVTETLEWCMGLGITEVTLYAFSLENFKRSKEEIDSLMELARQKFSALLNEKELINRHGLCLRIIGDLDYLPVDLQKLFAEGIRATKHNNRAFLNICCAYTSRDEITQAMKQLARGVAQGLIEESDIDEDLFDACLYTRHSPDPDIVIRTSGEVRLSDFLLWQSSHSVLSFSKVLWPEFTCWNFYAGILFYQRNHSAVCKAKAEKAERRRDARLEMDTKIVIEELKLAPATEFSPEKNETATGNIPDERKPEWPPTATEKFASALAEKVAERRKRTSDFLLFVENSYNEKISSLLKNDSTVADDVGSSESSHRDHNDVLAAID